MDNLEEIRQKKLQKDIEKEKRLIEKRDEQVGMDFCVNVSPEFRDWYYNLDAPPHGGSLGMGTWYKRKYYHVID